ncbi:hemolysin III family protein, partial [Micrococcus endophyticus]
MDPLTPAREPEAARRLRWRIERIRDPEHPLFKPRLRGWIHAAMAPLT